MVDDFADDFADDFVDVFVDDFVEDFADGSVRPFDRSFPQLDAVDGRAQTAAWHVAWLAGLPVCGLSTYRPRFRSSRQSPNMVKLRVTMAIWIASRMAMATVETKIVSAMPTATIRAAKPEPGSSSSR